MRCQKEAEVGFCMTRQIFPVDLASSFAFLQCVQVVELISDLFHSLRGVQTCFDHYLVEGVCPSDWRYKSPWFECQQDLR